MIRLRVGSIGTALIPLARFIALPADDSIARPRRRAARPSSVRTDAPAVRQRLTAAAAASFSRAPAMML